MKREHADFDSRWYDATIPSNHWHFHRRLLDRYGLVLGPGEFSAIQGEIVSGRAELIRRRPKASLYWVKIRSANTCVAILARGRALFTVLPATKKILRWRERVGLAAALDRAHSTTESEAV